MATTVQRRAAILTLLDLNGAVRNRDLVSALGVATSTVRRDLRRMADRGLITPVRGGAVAPGAGAVSSGTPRRPQTGGHRDENAAIAARAVRLVAPGASIGLGAGAINILIARSLVRVRGLTVVTTAPAIAEVFHDHHAQDQRILLIGGVMDPGGGCVGPIALAAIGRIFLDQLFLEVRALDAARGLLSPAHVRAEIDRALISASDHVVVMANHDAWQANALVPIAPLAAARTVITGGGLDAAARAEVRAAVGDLYLVGNECADADRSGSELLDGPS